MYVHVTSREHREDKRTTRPDTYINTNIPRDVGRMSPSTWGSLRLAPIIDVICVLSFSNKDNKTPLQDAATWALVLALSICYHARLQDRDGFENGVVQQFRPPLVLTEGVQQFKDEIRWYSVLYYHVKVPMCNLISSGVKRYYWRTCCWVVTLLRMLLSERMCS